MPHPEVEPADLDYYRLGLLQRKQNIWSVAYKCVGLSPLCLLVWPLYPTVTAAQIDDDVES